MIRITVRNRSDGTYWVNAVQTLGGRLRNKPMQFKTWRAASAWMKKTLKEGL